MLWFLIVQATVAGKDVAPQSWGAYAALLLSIVNAGFILIDRISGRGRSNQKLEGKVERLCEDLEKFKKEDFEDFQETQRVMDKHLDSLSVKVRDLTNEWRGQDGTNGWKSMVRQLLSDVKQIMERNTRIDAIAEYERQQMRKSGRSPERVRDKLEDIE